MLKGNMIGQEMAAKAYGDVTNLGNIPVRQQGVSGSEGIAGSNGITFDKNEEKKGGVLNGFADYVNQLKASAKEDRESELVSEEDAKEEAKEIAKNLSREEIAALKQMGIDVSTADLSDLMGMVNSMRGEARLNQINEVMASLSEDDLSNVQVVGGAAVTASGAELEGVSVTDVVAGNMKAEAEDTAAGAVSAKADPVKESFTIEESDLVYLVKNGLDFNESNLYKAHFSGMRLEEPADELLSSMKNEFDKVLEQAGLDTDEQGERLSGLLLANDVPATPENVRKLAAFESFKGEDAGNLDEKKVEQLEEQLTATVEKARELVDTVRSIAPEAVYDMAKAGRQVTIASAKAYMEENYGLYRADKLEAEGTGAAEKALENAERFADADAGALTAMRRMEEIRLSMTVQVSYRMLKMDINIDTRELSKVVADLRREEERLINEAFSRADVSATEENVSLYREMSMKMSVVSEAPAGIIGIGLNAGRFTVNALYEAAESDTVYEESADGTYSRQVLSGETVRRSYEAVGTTVRADMGDSISKAFANVDDILKDLGFEADYEHQRAVKILGYNSIEITTENIESVMDYDRQVNELIDTFYPEAVLGMIKDEINPMDVEISELVERIRQKNYNEGVSEAEDFATFLVDMEKSGNVTPEERDSYIGVFRMMNKLKKSGDREAGWLFANGSRLTVRNLLAAARSRQAKGLDVNIDEDFGMLEETAVKGARIDEQIESAFKDTLLGDHAAQLLSTDGESNLYNLAKQLISKMKLGEEMEKEKLADEEAERISRSLMGLDEGLDIGEMIAKLDSNNSLSEAYGAMKQQLTELMYDGAREAVYDIADLRMMKTVQAGFTVLSQEARQGRYSIPVGEGANMKIMHLTVKRDDAGMGGISVSIRGERMGLVEAKLSVSAEREVSGFVTASTAEGNEALAAASANAVAALSRDDFSSSVSFGRLDSEPAASTASLAESYATARSFVEWLAGIIE